MSFEAIAAHLGTTTNSVELLLRGQATDGLAESLGTNSSAVQKFINGQAPESIAEITNTNTAELQHLRNDMDEKGAIGFVLGLAIARQKVMG